MRKTLIRKKQQHMWYYFYSHSVCWYKVMHLSQTSSVWVVKVKTDLTLHCGPTGCPISKMISRANINRPIPVSMWQLYHHTDFSLSLGSPTAIHTSFKEAPFIGFLSETRVFFLRLENTSTFFSPKVGRFALKIYNEFSHFQIIWKSL